MSKRKSKKRIENLDLFFPSKDGLHCVNARGLHKRIGAKDKFTAWWKRSVLPLDKLTEELDYRVEVPPGTKASHPYCATYRLTGQAAIAVLQRESATNKREGAGNLLQATQGRRTLIKMREILAKGDQDELLYEPLTSAGKKCVAGRCGKLFVIGYVDPTDGEEVLIVTDTTWLLDDQIAELAFGRGYPLYDAIKPVITSIVHAGDQWQAGSAKDLALLLPEYDRHVKPKKEVRPIGSTPEEPVQAEEKAEAEPVSVTPDPLPKLFVPTLPGGYCVSCYGLFHRMELGHDRFTEWCGELTDELGLQPDDIFEAGCLLTPKAALAVIERDRYFRHYYNTILRRAIRGRQVAEFARDWFGPMALPCHQEGSTWRPYFSHASPDACETGMVVGAWCGNLMVAAFLDPADGQEVLVQLPSGDRLIDGQLLSVGQQPDNRQQELLNAFRPLIDDLVERATGGKHCNDPDVNRFPEYDDYQVKAKNDECGRVICWIMRPEDSLPTSNESQEEQSELPGVWGTKRAPKPPAYNPYISQIDYRLLPTDANDELAQARVQDIATSWLWMQVSGSRHLDIEMAVCAAVNPQLHAHTNDALKMLESKLMAMLNEEGLSDEAAFRQLAETIFAGAGEQNEFREALDAMEQAATQSAPDPIVFTSEMEYGVTTMDPEAKVLVTPDDGEADEAAASLSSWEEPDTGCWGVFREAVLSDYPDTPPLVVRPTQAGAEAFAAYLEKQDVIDQRYVVKMLPSHGCRSAGAGGLLGGGDATDALKKICRPPGEMITYQPQDFREPANGPWAKAQGASEDSSSGDGPDYKGEGDSSCSMSPAPPKLGFWSRFVEMVLGKRKPMDWVRSGEWDDAPPTRLESDPVIPRSVGMPKDDAPYQAIGVGLSAAQADKIEPGWRDRLQKKIAEHRAENERRFGPDTGDETGGQLPAVLPAGQKLAAEPGDKIRGWTIDDLIIDDDRPFDLSPVTERLAKLSADKREELAAVGRGAGRWAKLIPVTNKDGKTWVDARALHAQLESRKDFSSWVKYYIESRNLVEGKHFVVVPTERGKSQVGRPSIEYHLEVETAQHLAVSSNTVVGQEIRSYLIECERQLRTGPREPVVGLPLPKLHHISTQKERVAALPVMGQLLIELGKSLAEGEKLKEEFPMLPDDPEQKLTAAEAYIAGLNEMLTKIEKERDQLEAKVAELEDDGAVNTLTAEKAIAQTGDAPDPALELKDAKERIAQLETEKTEQHIDCMTYVAAVLKRGGKDVTNVSTMDRIAELHEAERQRDELTAAKQQAAIAEMQSDGSSLAADKLTELIEERERLFDKQQLELEEAKREADRWMALVKGPDEDVTLTDFFKETSSVLGFTDTAGIAHLVRKGIVYYAKSEEKPDHKYLWANGKYDCYFHHVRSKFRRPIKVNGVLTGDHDLITTYTAKLIPDRHTLDGQVYRIGGYSWLKRLLMEDELTTLHRLIAETGGPTGEFRRFKGWILAKDKADSLPGLPDVGEKVITIAKGTGDGELKKGAWVAGCRTESGTEQATGLTLRDALRNLRDKLAG